MPSVSIFLPKVRGKRTDTWWMAWRESGKLRRVSTGSRNKAIAKAIAKEHEDKLVVTPLGLTKLLKPSVTTWDDAITEWLDEVANKNRPSTHESYATCLANYKSVMSPTQLADVTTISLEQYASKRIGNKDKPVTPETVNRDLRSIRVFVKWCKRRGYRHDLPEFDTVFIREDIRRPRVVPLDTIDLLLKALPKTKLTSRPAEWWQLLLELLRSTGCRTGEALGLTWDNVDLERGTVMYSAISSKGRRDRMLPLPGSLVKSLRALKATGTGQGPVLPWPFFVLSGKSKGKPDRRRLYREWKRICEKAGVPAPKFKHFRSTTGSRLVEAGAALSTVQAYLGHSSPSVTAKHYLDSTPMLRQAMEAREKLDAGGI